MPCILKRSAGLALDSELLKHITHSDTFMPQYSTTVWILRAISSQMKCFYFTRGFLKMLKKEKEKTNV